MRQSKTRYSAYDLTVIILCGIALVALGQLRLIDRDEGFYLLAARQVVSGKVPYLDFFYPQMPLFPYLYGMWMSIFGMTWESARVLTSLCTLMLAGLAYDYLRTNWNRSAGAVALVLFVISNFIFPWYLVAKTYALSTLLLFASCILAVGHFRLSDFTRWILVGVLFSLSVQIRLFFAGLLPVFVCFIAFSEGSREERWKRLALFIAAGAIATLPSAILMARDYHAFFYNNLGYHLLRSTRDAEEMSEHRGRLLAILFGFKNPIRDRGVNLPMMLYLALGSILLSIYTRRIPTFFVWIAGALFILNFLPTPPYVQYFSTLAPFLIVIGILFVRDVMSATENTPRVRWMIAALLCVGAVRYASIFPGEVTRHAVTGRFVLGIGTPQRAPWFTLRAMDEISARIDLLTSPGDRVITLWPGYLLESHADVYPRFENHFGFPASLRVSRDEIRHYHLPSVPYLLRSIESGAARLVLTIPGSESVHVKGALSRGGYRFDGALNGVRIWSHGGIDPAEPLVTP